LRRIREARAIEIGDIAQRTKIGAAHLRAIEEEHWEAMPALVYLRGFLTGYARFLKLDAEQVTRTYLDRHR
jgi:flagellar biosynthesis protein FlhG